MGHYREENYYCYKEGAGYHTQNGEKLQINSGDKVEFTFNEQGQVVYSRLKPT